MNRRSLLAGLATGLAMPTLARAQSAAEMFARANAHTVGIISGGLDGTYTRFAADIAAVLDGVDDLRILPVLGKGSLQNLADLLYMRGVDVAIVQSDVLAAAAQQRVFPMIEQQVRYITKLYTRLIHTGEGEWVTWCEFRSRIKALSRDPATARATPWVKRHRSSPPPSTRASPSRPAPSA
jgi:uncharacterized protein